MNTLTYDVDSRIARIMLDRPERGNGITLEMPRELSQCAEGYEFARRAAETGFKRAVRERDAPYED